MPHELSNRLLEATVRSKFLPELFGGQNTHDPARGLIGQLVQHTGDSEIITEIVRAALGPNYAGNTLDEVPGLIKGALAKGFDKKKRKERLYKPGSEGPIALGFTRDGLYAVRDQARSIINLCSAHQLLSSQHLIGLASSRFWAKQFPKKGNHRAFDFTAAGEAIIEACRKAGPFNPLKVRGRGVWLEDDQIVINLGTPLPEKTAFLYLCFEPIPLVAKSVVEASRLLTFLQAFAWRNPQDAMLVLGWIAIAPICGVLRWRPHLFLHGPPKCGKTTIHGLLTSVLTPLVISADGGSSEAGIRQTLGPDSLAVMIDEFESDQRGFALRAVLRLARSASSADTPVLKGTPDGKAMQFSLRTTFMFSAVNPAGMTAADESRIVQLQLLKPGKGRTPDENREAAAFIQAEAHFFRNKGPDWCSYMVSMAALIPPAIDVIDLELPSDDKRHRQNMSTLLAGSFVALHGRVPTKEEAAALTREYGGTVSLHAEALERDDAADCLAHMMAYVHERYPLGHWLGLAYRASEARYHNDTVPVGYAETYVRIFDMLFFDHPEHGRGILLRNRSPAIERVFADTRWEGNGWKAALDKLDGSARMEPKYFPNSGTKHRSLYIPGSYIPEPFEILMPMDARV